MNPRDKMTLNPAPIRNPGKPLKGGLVAPSQRAFKRVDRINRLREKRKQFRHAIAQLAYRPTTGDFHRAMRAARA